MADLPYTRLPDVPAEPGARTVMVRLVDGLGFRYRWATEGLSDIDPDFRPGEGSMSVRELLDHVAELVHWVIEQMGFEAEPPGTDPDAVRRRTLLDIVAIREHLLDMDDAALAAITVVGRRDTGSFWHLVNGPLADALTHVGQINAWRRLAGNPPPRANVFMGRPPEDRAS
ncbi:MAG: DinB family protein [Planctomycetota bacterium]|jgi:uncharacterized damage-inducible protein DinB